MRRMMLILFFLLFMHGCLDKHTNISISKEVNKITVVQYSPYMKHYRAYFSRSHLKILPNNKKYLYLYHAKKNDLGLLLYRDKRYILYNLSKPKQQALVVKVNATNQYSDVLQNFKEKGFNTIGSLAEKGYTVTVSAQRYKGSKTLRVEIKEYSQLQTLYKKAIKNYNANKIKNIQTSLPTSLIYSYYRFYEKNATCQVAFNELKIIAQKLHIKTNFPVYTRKKSAAKQKNLPENKELCISMPSVKSFSYYLKDASINELHTYIAYKCTKDSLSYNQYHLLKKRVTLLEEEKLLNEGSLEELITAYKIDKDPKYKNRIIILMKDTQENQWNSLL